MGDLQEWGGPSRTSSRVSKKIYRPRLLVYVLLTRTGHARTGSAPTHTRTLSRPFYAPRQHISIIFLEYCKKGCGKEFERSHDVENEVANAYFEELQENGNAKRSKKAIRGVEQCQHCQLTHQTTRSCDHCDLPLFDTIINFGDMLRDSQIQPATNQANKADVVIVLGSTLLVTPAADLCEPKSGQQLVICNRQETPLDDNAAVRIFGDCDMFLDLLLSKLMGSTEMYEAWKQGREARMVDYNRLKQQK